jgi:transketolase
MASTFGWGRYTGLKGRNVGMHRFGASAPLKDLLKYFGFTVDTVVAEARAAIAGK